MKLMTVLFLVLCGMVFGAYDNSAVDVAVGYGNADNTTVRFSGTNQLGWNEQYPITASGILKEVTFSFFNTSATSTDSVIVILSESGGTYTVEKAFRSAQLLTDSAIEGKNSRTYDMSSLNLTVEAGWFLAVGTAFSAGTNGYISDSSVALTRNTASGLAAIVDDYTFTVVSTSLSRVIKIEAVVETNETIVLDDSTGWTGANEINIPYYDSENQYIVIEDIVVPDTESLDILLKYTHPTTGVDTTLKTLTVSFLADGTNSTIIMDAKTASITGQEGEKLTAHIWLDPVNDLIEVLFVNYEDGQGPQGDKDIKHISLQDRVPIAITADVKLRRIELVNAGGNATVARVVSCRKPVLAIGDSFVSTYTTETALTRVGAELALATAFTEQRYVINGGITGNSVTRDSSTNCTAIRTRWNDDDQDLVDFRDVVTVFVNGPGLNDFVAFIDENSTAAEMSAMVERITGDIARMAGDNQSDFLTAANDKVSNDTILCEMIPYEANTGQEKVNEQSVQASINANLTGLSYSLQVPIALTFNAYLANGAYSDSGTHPDAAGITWIAEQIVDAYENNEIANNPHAGVNSIYGPKQSIYGGN